MKYYAATREKEILPLAMTLMDLEAIMLKEINLIKANTEEPLIYVESGKAKLVDTESRMNGHYNREHGIRRHVGQGVSTLSYKINKPWWSCVQQHGDYSEQHCIIYPIVARTVCLKCSHHRERCTYMTF